MDGPDEQDLSAKRTRKSRWLSVNSLYVVSSSFNAVAISSVDSKKPLASTWG